MTNIIDSGRQPAFLANNSTTRSAVTGDGTIYTLIFNTLINGNNFNTSSGVFTASVSGWYIFNVCVIYGGLNSAETTGTINVITTSVTYPVSNGNPGLCRAPDNSFLLRGCIMGNMNTGDTAYCTTQVSGSTKGVSINGSSVYTYFSARRMF